MARIVVSDPLSPEGFALLEARGHEAVDVTSLEGDARADAIAGAEGWVVRSGTRIGPDELAAAPNLRGIGRAGVGVDNVDLGAATNRGIAVFNSPTGNITSAAEQAWALMLGAARRVPEADAAMKAEDWARKRLKGSELAGKTLFIVGLGKIGRMMAKRAQAFEMTCIGHDPFVTPEAAKGFGVEWVEVDDGMARADIISLHTPLVPATKDLIDARRLGLCKKGAMLVNAARGGLMVADDVLAALESGQLGSAGIDVWPDEPPTDWSLAKHPRVVAAPHLGASTVEAQTKAAVQACERLCDFLDTGDAGLAVNAVATVPEALRPWADLAGCLACFAAQTVEGAIEELVICATPGLDAAALEVPAVAGALRSSSETPINAINAPGLAKAQGWTVATKALPEDDDKYLRVHVRTKKGERIVEGTYTPHYGPRVTSVDGFDVEFRARGRLLVTLHDDVPGVLARITGVLAEAQVNVAAVSLARKGGQAIGVIEVDGSIPRDARDALRGIAAVNQAHRVRL